MVQVKASWCHSGPVVLIMVQPEALKVPVEALDRLAVGETVVGGLRSSLVIQIAPANETAAVRGNPHTLLLFLYSCRLRAKTLVDLP